MDVRFAVFELHKWIAAAAGNVDGSQQLVHQLIRGQLETLLELFSMVGQPTLHIKDIECFVGRASKALFKRLRCAITQHGVHTRVVHRLFRVQQKLFLNLTIGDQPIRRLPI